MGQEKTLIYTCDNCDGRSENMGHSDRLPYNWSVVRISNDKGACFQKEITLCAGCVGQTNTDWRAKQDKTSLDLIGKIFKAAFSRRKKDENGKN